MTLIKISMLDGCKTSLGFLLAGSTCRLPELEARTLIKHGIARAVESAGDPPPHPRPSLEPADPPAELEPEDYGD